MKTLCATFLLLTVLTSISAQKSTINSDKQREQLSLAVTELFKSNNISEAFEELSKYWPLPQTELDDLESKTIKYMNMLTDRFGTPIGTAKIKTEKINDFALRDTYFVKYQNTAIRIIITYYKNNDGWIVNAFKWDDSFTEEFIPTEN